MTWFNYSTTTDHNSTSHQSRFKPRIASRRVALILSYAPDWILSILIGGLFFVLGSVNGFKRAFSLTDTSLQYPYAVHERIPDYALGLIAFIAPLLLMPFVNLLSVRSFWDWHNSSLGLVSACAYTGTITNIVKVTTGRPRPDVINRCLPRSGSADAPVYGLVTSAICTQTDDAILKDGWKSFFSGHSSLSFAGLGFLSFYLAGKMHLFDKRGHVGKAWLSMTPLAGASLVAISRTMDYRHHWHDVLIGSLVGLLFAYFSYRQYYPPLTSSASHLPYQPRLDIIEGKGKGGRPVLPMHRQSEHSMHGMAGQHEEGEEEEAEALEADRTVPRPGANMELDDGAKQAVR